MKPSECKQNQGLEFPNSYATVRERQMTDTFRKILADGRCVYGPFMKTTDPMFVEIAGLAGFDFVILDMEHGPGTCENQQGNIRAAELSGVVPIIRVPELNENIIGKSLDIGAAGVQIPQVRTAEEARMAVKYSRFHPYGMRGVCRFVRAAGYSSKERREYFEDSAGLLVIVQLEGVEAVENLDAILDVEGIDILFIGPYDLSQSLGVPGEVESETVVNKMREIIQRAGEKGKTVGTFVDSMRMLKLWRDAGVQYLSWSVDSGIFMDACRKLVDEIHGREEGK